MTEIWCTCGALDKVTDANGNTTTWERDVQGRETKEIRANGTEWISTYENTTSRLKQLTDPKGQSANYSYFVDGELKQVTHSNAVYTTPSVNLTFDPAYPRLTSIVDGTGTSTFTYHAMGGLGAGQVASVDGPGASDTVTYSYDEMGRPTGRTIDSMTTTYGFDVLHRLATVTHPPGTFALGYAGTTHRRSGLTYPSGATTTYAYTTAGGDHHLEEIHHKFPGGATLAKFNHTHDDQDNLKTWQQQDESNAARIYDLSYDAADQLTSAVYRTTDATPTILKRYGFTYDAGSNRTTYQLDDAPLQGTYNNVNRLLSQQPAGALRFAGASNEAATVTVQAKPATTTADNKFAGPAQVGSGTNTVAVTATDPAGNASTNSYQVSVSGSTKSYTYDNNGNLTQKVDGDTWGYEWYADDRLARVTKNSIEQARFVYDGRGRRYQKIAAGVTTTYTYDGEAVLREDVSTGTTYRYVNGSEWMRCSLGAIRPGWRRFITRTILGAS